MRKFDKLEYVTLLGYSGSGKTSFMKAVKHGLTGVNYLLSKGVDGYYCDGRMVSREYFKEWRELKRHLTMSTVKSEDFDLVISHRKKVAQICWMDYRGGDYQKLEEQLMNKLCRCVDRSKLVLLLLDGQYASKSGEFQALGTVILEDGSTKLDMKKFKDGNEYIREMVPQMMEVFEGTTNPVTLVPVVTKADMFMNDRNYAEMVAFYQRYVEGCAAKYSNVRCESHARLSSIVNGSYSPAKVFVGALREHDVL